jgi:hypothetical protein
MTAQKLSTVTNEIIESSGNTAKNVINAYRVGSDRAVVFMDQSFVAALDKAGTRLSTEARNNALAAEKKITAFYTKSVETSIKNANDVVSKAVELAEKGVVQVAANAGRFEKSTGMTTLTSLAEAAIPAAQAVTKVAAKLEIQSGRLANKMAGKSVKIKAVPVKRAVAKKVARPVKKVA